VKRQCTSYTSYHSGSSHSLAPITATASTTSAQPSTSTILKLSMLLRSKIDISPSYHFPPKPTDVERDMLHTNKGCCVCHQLFADHLLPCSLLPPDTTVYQPITTEHVNEVKRGHPIAAFNSEHAIMPPSDKNDISLPIVAVVPSETVPFTLGNGSFSMHKVGPLSIKHFLWSAKAWIPEDTFLSLKCLIDTGAHLNCVRNDISKLGLKIKHLAKPLSVTFSDEQG